MFHSKRVNLERSFCIVYKNNYSSNVDLLAKDKSFTIHQRNIESLTIVLFKVKKNLSNAIMCNILKAKTLTYNLQSQTDFARDCVKKEVISPLSYFAAKVWELVPSEIKNVNSLQKFKTVIRK